MTPVTTPPVTVAIAGPPLLHMPPDVASVKVIVLPAQTVGLAGNIEPGAVFTETMAVAEHPAAV